MTTRSSLPAGADPPRGTAPEVVAPRDAATVIVARDGADGVEVFMLRRSARSDFVPDAYVFPGGGVEEADFAPELWARCAGLGDAEASRRLGMPRGGTALWVAAVRECFEEAGLLLGLRGGEAVAGDELVERRSALNAGETTFADLCVVHDLTLPLDRIHFVSHWITPAGSPIRYDTRFFLAAAPEGQSGLHDGVETVDNRWFTPRQALADHEAGRLLLVPATRAQLDMVARFPTTAALLAHAAALTDVPTVEPVIIRGADGEPDRVRIPLPGGPIEIPLSP